jgi:hypothetical protein
MRAGLRSMMRAHNNAAACDPMAAPTEFPKETGVPTATGS